MGRGRRLVAPKPSEAQHADFAQNAPRLPVAATAVFGGTLGALATVATTSQASPQAIAAAVQKVQDRAAERNLQTIGVELLRLNEEDQSKLNGDLSQLNEAVENLRKNTFLVCFDTGSLEQRAGCTR